MEAVLNEHREHERSLQSTLMTAQKLADDIKENADWKRSASSGKPRDDRTSAGEDPGAARRRAARD